jgi:hypothetical protein
VENKEVKSKRLGKGRRKRGRIKEHVYERGL